MVMSESGGATPESQTIRAVRMLGAAGFLCLIEAVALALGGLGATAVNAPVVEAASNQFYMHAANLMDNTAPTGASAGHQASPAPVVDDAQMTLFGARILFARL